MEDIKISCSDLTKDFFTYTSGHQKIQHRLLGLKEPPNRIRALNNVSFTVQRGEKIALMGNLSSGRSTLLRLLAGFYPPSTGSIEVNGQATPYYSHLLGFDMELAGRDNYKNRAKLRGWSKKEIAEKEKEVFEFAELTELANSPLKTYPRGAVSRLGFAIGLAKTPDILLYDAFLVFGNTKINKKYTEAFREFLTDDVTLIMTMSNVATAQSICTRGIVLHEGALVFDGAFSESLAYYRTNCKPSAYTNSAKNSAAEDETAMVDEDDDNSDSMSDGMF